jgi:hypothetical protein
MSMPDAGQKLRPGGARLWRDEQKIRVWALPPGDSGVFGGAVQVLKYLEFLRDAANSFVLGMEIAGWCLI